MSRPPPPVTPKPGQVKVVRAVFSYQAQAQDELSFEDGDLLYITDMSNKDWWRARCGEKSGLIPTNYVSQSTESIDNPLHEAAKRGNMEFLQECLRNQVSPNGLDKAGCTPLHWAAHGGHMECLLALLDTKCQVDVQNKLGDTPLHSAAWKGHLEVVKCLLEHGARTDVNNKDGKKAGEMAHDPTVKVLLVPRGSSSKLERPGDYGGESDSD